MLILKSFIYDSKTLKKKKKTLNYSLNIPYIGKIRCCVLFLFKTIYKSVYKLIYQTCIVYVYFKFYNIYSYHLLITPYLIMCLNLKIISNHQNINSHELCHLFDKLFKLDK